MPRLKKTAGSAKATQVETFVHVEEQRTNIPTAELETFMKDEDREPKTVTYLRPSELLFPRDPAGDPQLVWRGKDQQDRRPLEVMAPPIYIQEKIHPKAIIEDLRKHKRGETPAQADLFNDFNGIEFEDLVDFYQHAQHWSNRMILGDSLEVMTSLAEREGLRGQVQCIYMDPPYGISFGSNWQSSTRKRDVKDNSESATRQPEQVKAFRDTWSDGIHSYLAYNRDRLTVAHALLAVGGSLFVQIGDENVHRVRAILDEIFGSPNSIAQINFKSMGALGQSGLAKTYDYLLWYAKDAAALKFRPLYRRQVITGDPEYRYVATDDGGFRTVTAEEAAHIDQLEGVFRRSTLTSSGYTPSCTFEFSFQGQPFRPFSNKSWRTNREGIERLIAAGRLFRLGDNIYFKRYASDFKLIQLENSWTDPPPAFARRYVVETAPKFVERCILMTTDPADLVLDPTCGSGTTAFVAEQWGRRWITVDTSRVALALTRQRLMAARFPQYRLVDDLGMDLRRGFIYKTAPHVTLKSIANNPDIRGGMAQAQIDAAIAKHADQELLFDDPEVDRAVVRVTGPFTVESLSPNAGVAAVAESDERVAPAVDTSSDFIAWIIDNVRAAGVQNTVRRERLTFDRVEPWPGEHIQAVGEYSDDRRPRRAAVTIGPQYGTVDADLVRAAAKEAAGFFDLLIICGFAFDAYIANEFKQLGKLTILKANMNPDLSMGGDLLKKTGSGNLFTVFGEPDIDVRREADDVVVEIRGLDVYDPTTGQVRSHTTADIACWFIDTAYDGNSFFVRHAYFTGAGDPYKSLKSALKADIDEEAWASLYSTVSRPFEMPTSGKIAVKVINHYGDEVMKVYQAPSADGVALPQRPSPASSPTNQLVVADRSADAAV